MDCLLIRTKSGNPIKLQKVCLLSYKEDKLWCRDTSVSTNRSLSDRPVFYYRPYHAVVKLRAQYIECCCYIEIYNVSMMSPIC